MHHSDEFAAALPQLRRLARALTKDPARAEDLVQEAFLRVWSRLAEGAEIDSLAPYLKETLRNLARRPDARTAPAGEPLSEVAEPAVAPDSILRLTLDEVAEALAELPAEEARLFSHLIAGEEVERIARLEALPRGTVMSRIARARARLRRRCDIGRGDIARLAGS